MIYIYYLFTCTNLNILNTQWFMLVSLMLVVLMYRVHCILYSVQYTVYSVHCTLYSVQYTVYSVQCTLYHAHYTLYVMYCTWLCICLRSINRICVLLLRKEMGVFVCMNEYLHEWMHLNHVHCTYVRMLHCLNYLTCSYIKDV